MSDSTLKNVLKEIGFCYKDASMAQNFTETLKIQEWRREYLRQRKAIRTLQGTKDEAYEVWLDELYCNQHHIGKKSWYREGNIVKMGNKGRRFVIINANGKEGWCGESMVFEAKSNSSDYQYDRRDF
jgi:hypothetical protein